MDLRRTVIMALLLGTLAWAWMTSPLTKQLRGASVKRPTQAVRQTGADQPGVAQPRGSPSGASPLSREELARWRERYENAWRRDPFLTAEEERALLSPKAVPQRAKSAAPPAPLPSYSVKAILISEAEKVATIGGRLISEGELLGEERVVEIRPDGVVLERAGQRRRIGLPGGTTPITEAESR